METWTGYVERIVYKNEENGYTVLTISTEGRENTITGILPQVSVGELLEAQGEVKDHPIYGPQMAVITWKVKVPEDLEAIRRYLGSGAIKGIGEALAGRIVKRFGMDTLRIMEEEPERLAEVKGISEKKAVQLAEQIAEKRDMRQAMMFLQEYGISLNMSARIFERYGNSLYTVIRENPYQLAEDVNGIGFKIADSIAMRAGIRPESEFRVRSGILYTLQQAAGNGHLYLPLDELKGQAAELLQVDPDMVEQLVYDLMMSKRVVCRSPKEDNEKVQVFLSSYYYMERNTARMLVDLNVEMPVREEDFERRMAGIQKQRKRELDEHQHEAVLGAVSHGVFLVTGGPGTGKTTTIQAILDYFEGEQKTIFLAAPTGRAAKRTSEATGREARTIHRMLELTGPQDGTDRAFFSRDEENPLEADVVVIDEMSMVDMQLMFALCKAIAPGTHLILVGDVDQLPSVGPGNVLKDLIASGVFPVARLTRIFRQAEDSDIVVNAHRINHGEIPDLGKKSRDFLFIRRPDANAVINACITLVKQKLPAYVNAKASEIQVMTPMRKGALGVERLNVIFQEYFNPPSPGKVEKEHEQGVFREGDKVMQIRNNYQMEWEVKGRFGIPREEGTGVFNGDIGVITEINLQLEQLTVLFDDEREAVYSFKELSDLELAYAITIHKSQGSEYPAVVIPLLTGPRMLMTRNLLYTAVTRAKACVCLVGSPDTFCSMVGNNVEQRRYSGLADRLQEMNGERE